MPKQTRIASTTRIMTKYTYKLVNSVGEALYFRCKNKKIGKYGGIYQCIKIIKGNQNLFFPIIKTFGGGYQNKRPCLRRSSLQWSLEKENTRLYILGDEEQKTIELLYE